MTIKRTLLPLALGTLGVTTMVQVAGATHPRPKGATPLRVSLVPAYKPCLAPNRTHGAPLAFPSCSSPVPQSDFLTVGTPDANGAGTTSIGFLNLKVKTTSPEALLISGTVTDVRCRPATAAGVCSGANATSGPDYSGQLQANATIRVTDHYNGPGLNEAATIQDIPFPINLDCANTVDTTAGGVCTVSTNMPLACPDCGGVQEGQRTLVEIGQMQVFDGGPDGQVATADNTVFLRQGIFIP
jgi:hypothetical protein